MTSEKKRTMAELLDDGTLTDIERAELSNRAFDVKAQGLGNSGTEVHTADEDHQGFVRELQQAVTSARLTYEDDPVDPTVVEGVVNKLEQLAMQETHAIGSSQTDAQENKPNAPDGPSDLSGQMIGSYRILRKLSQGGMGIVYEAEDTHLKRRIAIKTMQPRIAANSQNRLRFMREAQAAAQVEHDHICPIFQVGEDQGVPFIAMPFLQGESLETFLKRGKIDVKQTLQLSIEIAQGLSAAHTAGLVHRDVKPGNVWIESKPDGIKRVRLLDFGLAHFESDEGQLTQSGMILGTPSYMAPEQARSEPVDARADLFAMGAMLYEMLTGKRAFAGNNTVSILTSVAVENPLPPQELNASIPKELSELVMQLLSKRPAQRPESAEFVAKKLQQLRMDIAKFESQAQANHFVNEISVTDGPESRTSQASASTVTLPKLQSAASRNRWLFPALIGLSMLGVSLAAIQLLFQTKDGVLLVESDEDTDLRFRNGALQIFDEAGVLRYTIKADETNRTVKPGNYRVQVIGADGVQLSTEKFEMTSGGEVRVRVTARPTETVAPQIAKDNKTELPSDTLFPGKLIRKEIFDAESTKLTSKTEKNQRTIIEDGQFTLLSDMSRAQEARSIDLIGSLESGAVVTRCRVTNCIPFLNFCVRLDGTRFRWLTVAAFERASRLTLHRSDRVGNDWNILAPTVLETEIVKQLDLSAGKWVDIAARWSLEDFDVWINGQHVHGRALPTKELTIGESGRVELAITSIAAGESRLEVDYFMIWDQSGVPVSEAMPVGLPGRE